MIRILKSFIAIFVLYGSFSIFIRCGLTKSLQSNIVVSEDHRLLLIDFGIAKVERIQTIIMTAGDPQGSFRWMAPELLTTAEDGRGPVLSTRTDVYAFAMTCVEVRLS